MRERYLAAFPTLDREAFDSSYAIIGAQRNTRISAPSAASAARRQVRNQHNPARLETCRK